MRRPSGKFSFMTGKASWLQAGDSLCCIVCWKSKGLTIQACDLFQKDVGRDPDDGNEQVRSTVTRDSDLPSMDNGHCPEMAEEPKGRSSTTTQYCSPAKQDHTKQPQSLETQPCGRG